MGSLHRRATQERTSPAVAAGVDEYRADGPRPSQEEKRARLRHGRLRARPQTRRPEAMRSLPGSHGASPCDQEGLWRSRHLLIPGTLGSSVSAARGRCRMVIAAGLPGCHRFDTALLGRSFKPPATRNGTCPARQPAVEALDAAVLHELARLGGQVSDAVSETLRSSRRSPRGSSSLGRRAPDPSGMRTWDSRIPCRAARGRASITSRPTPPRAHQPRPTG